MHAFTHAYLTLYAHRDYMAITTKIFTVHQFNLTIIAGIFNLDHLISKEWLPEPLGFLSHSPLAPWL